MYWKMRYLPHAAVHVYRSPTSYYWRYSITYIHSKQNRYCVNLWGGNKDGINLDEVRVRAAEHIVENVQLVAREARLLTLLPLVLVCAAKLLECMRHLPRTAHAAMRPFRETMSLSVNFSSVNSCQYGNRRPSYPCLLYTSPSPRD